MTSRPNSPASSPLRSRAVTLGAAAVALCLTLAGCTGAPPEESEPLRAVTATPEQPLTLVAEAGEEQASLQTSRALFAAAPVVVLAGAGDVAAQRLAAAAAIALGAPLLIGAGSTTGSADRDNTGADANDDAAAEPGAALADELDRLGTEAVLAVGTSLDSPGLSVIAVDASDTEVSRAAGRDLDATGDSNVAEIADLAAPASDGGPVPSDAATAANPAEDGDTLPAVVPGEPVEGTVALAVDADRNLASIASARAAGVSVQLVPAASPNPQASGAAVDALHASSTGSTLAIGPEFAAEAALDWKIRAARTGVQLPGGGQQVFGSRQFVALYGTPGTPSMGVLGEQDLAGAVQRTKDVAAPYQELTDKTVVPMFEMIATVAAGSAGPDGNYSHELDAATLRPWIDEAAAAGIYVVIDLQPGRTDFLTQAKQYEELLRLPHVGLAIDPEWRLAPDQVHLRQIGAVDTAEINTVTQWLAELTNQNSLPQKMVVLHQFRPSMIRDRASLDMTHPELAMLIHADGLGSQPDKQASWRALHEGAPAGIAWGWKNFYDEDTPMLDPAQTVQDVSPVPDLVTYQ
jgi:hypothetical protein